MAAPMPSIVSPAQPIATGRHDPRTAASASVTSAGSNFAMTGDALMALARLAVDMPIETASAQLGMQWEAVQPFLFATGLSPLGRLIAGPRAWEIDRLLAAQRIDPPAQTQAEHVQPSKDTSAQTAMQWLDDELDDPNPSNALVDDIMASLLHEIDGASSTQPREDTPPAPTPGRTQGENDAEDDVYRTVDSWLLDSPGRSPGDPS